MRASAAEEESLRTLTADYGRALVAGDLDALRKFWNPQSPNLSTQFRSYKNTFAQARFEFTSPEVTRLEITGDKAISHLTVDERRLDKKTQAVLLISGAFRGACRSFEWTRTSAGWRIEREFLVQDELALRLEAAGSDQQRDEILEKEKRFVNNTLVSALGAKALRHSTRGEFETALRYIRLQQTLAERIGDQAGVAAAWLNTAIVRNTQDEPEAALEPAHKALALYESLGLKRGVATRAGKSEQHLSRTGESPARLRLRAKITSSLRGREPPQSNNVWRYRNSRSFTGSKTTASRRWPTSNAPSRLRRSLATPS